MMLHPYSYTMTCRDESNGERRPIARFNVIATIEEGLTSDRDAADHWYVSAITAFELAADGVSSVREFPIHGDEALFDLILAAILIDDEGKITAAWAKHLARRDASKPASAAAADARAAMH